VIQLKVYVYQEYRVGATHKGLNSRKGV